MHKYNFKFYLFIYFLVKGASSTCDTYWIYLFLSGHKNLDKYNKIMATFFAKKKKERKPKHFSFSGFS